MRKPCDCSQLVTCWMSSSRHAELLAKLLGGQPFVELGRLPVVELVDQLVKRLFLLGRALEKEKNVVDVQAGREPGRDN